MNTNKTVPDDWPNCCIPLTFFDGYIPNKLIAGSASENNMPLLENRYNPKNTLIYVCVNKACKLPVSEVSEAMKLIDNK